MSQPATGAAVLYGLRRELAFGVPDLSKSRIFYHPAGQLTADLVRALGQSPEINASGFRQRGIPGPITGPLSQPIMLTAGTFLEFLENIAGPLTKSTLEAGVFQYVATPTRAGVETNFDALLSKQPVDHGFGRGIGFSG